MKDDKIYEMLNDAEIDLNEYEVEELASEEKERYKTRIRMEVKRMNMETRNKKNKNIRKITVIPIPKIIVSVVPAQNDVAPKYIVHTKNKTNITI